MGTLDPMANSVSYCVVGRAAKGVGNIMSGKKRYNGDTASRIETIHKTYGTVFAEHKGELPSFEEVLNACRTFAGEYMQTPPMYSALKRGGQKLVDLARRGVEVERTPRPVYIYSIDAACTERPDEYKIDVSCSSGTYVRTLCADIGRRLGCGGCMILSAHGSEGLIYRCKKLTKVSGNPAVS